MPRFGTLRTRLACAALLVSVIATPLTAGPPWISVELPGNPYDQTSRDAFLIVHAFHHGEPVDYPVSGVAEGMVKGQRTSIPLTFRKTSRSGAFALSKQWTDGTPWVLALTVAQGADDKVTALVTIATDGHASKVETLTRVAEKGIVLPRPLVRGDIDAALREASVAAMR